MLGLIPRGFLSGFQLLTAADIVALYGSNGIFGDGSDGDVTIVGTVLATRDMYYNNLIVPNGAILKAEGYRIHVKGTLTTLFAGGVSGIIQSDGSPGTGATGLGGSGAPGGTLGAGFGGGASGVNNGSNGGAASAQFPGYVQTAGTGTGGSGTAAKVGGISGAITNMTANNGGMRTPNWLMAGQALGGGGAAATQTLARGGAGGGGGGGNGATQGGGGGGGGGYLFIAAFTTVNNGIIRAAGGDGQAGNNVNTGGGGGGNGGVCALITNVFSGNEPTAPGGIKGANNGAILVAAQDGSVGTVIRMRA